MNLPRLHTLMSWGSQYKIIWSIDAKAYFFQFKLSGRSELWFPMDFRTPEGVESYYMNRLPMGCSLAPIIAQRCSNIVIERTRNKMRGKVAGEVAAWVDNFIIFAETEADAEKIMTLLQGQLTLFQIECSEVDRSGEFLGLVKQDDGLQLSPKFREALRADIDTIIKNSSCVKKDLERLAGKLLWLNYTTLRSPLVNFPATLALLREIPSYKEGTEITTSEFFLGELKDWRAGVDNLYVHQSPLDSTPQVWSDATLRRLAVVSGSLVLIAELGHDVDIALAEAIAAAWGLQVHDNTAHLFIDNIGVAHAFSKGHCKSDAVNTILGKVFKNKVRGSVTWIPTTDQVADGPTRDKLPRFVAEAPERWLKIRSHIFID